MGRNLSEDLVEFRPSIVVTQTTLIILIMIASLICNFLVAIVIARKTELNSNSSNKFLLNLTVANSFLSVMVLPFVLVSSVKQRWIFGNAWCQASGFFTTLLCTDSILTAMILSIDRYHCILNPLQYPTTMSVVKTRVLITYTWLQSLFTAVLPLIGWGKYGFQFEKSTCTVLWNSPRSEGYTKLYALCTFMVPFLVMCWAYYHILRAARRQARVGQIAVLSVSYRSSISSTVSGSFTGSKAIRTTILVLGTVSLCWGLYTVTIILESSKIYVPHELHVTAMILNFLISFLYPVIYGIRVKVIRREIRRLLFSVICFGDTYRNAVHPINATEAAFFVSPAARAFRNRSVSDGSVNSIDFEGAPKTEPDRDICVGWCLPAIREEIDATNSNQKLTELTDLEITSLTIPGQIVEGK